MRRKALICMMVGLIVATNLSGCSSIIGVNAKDLPLVTQLSEKEVVDYYKQALEFDTIASKNIDVKEVSYEAKDVTEAKATELKELVSTIESELSSMVYNGSYPELLSENTFHYIKAYLNSIKLENGNVTKASEALGYYFVDVEYDMGPNSLGTLLSTSTLLGLHGAFSQDYLGVDTVNTTYINKSVSALNNYYVDNGIDKTVSFDPATWGLYMTDNKLEALDFSGGDTELSQPTSDRIVKIDTKEFNSMAGASISQSSYMPKLEEVFTPPGAEGTLSGIGAYPAGDGGLRKFGYDRAKLSGKMTLRYVFKSDTKNPTEILGVNVYPVFSEIVSGINTDTDNVLIPDFLLTEFDKLIERSDRAIANGDLAGLMSGSIYSDAGVGVLTGYKSNYTNLLRNMSTVRRVVARDTEKGAYLLEVETIREEGPKGVYGTGVYRDKNYVVVEQIGDEFVITDSLNMTSKMTKEPSINPDSAITKRLVALNLAGEVTEESKQGIEELMQSLYLASTNRILNGPQDIKNMRIERGMYDCFNSDVNMLSTSRKEYINSTIRDLLLRYGTDVDATYTGNITEWIGGADNQAEFTTEEIVHYDKRNSAGYYMQVYYLVSDMGGKWVIDDMKIVESEEKTGDELKQIIDRLSNK